MKKRNELPKLDKSMFEVIENKKLSFIVGGSGTTQTVTAGYNMATKFGDGADA